MQKDELQLVEQAKQGDENALAALIAHMMPSVRKGAALNMAPGLDFEDAVQEGIIGMFHAVHSYRTEEGCGFASYAAACILHAQQDARRTALRKKNAPLNFSVPLSEETPAPGPEELAIANEEYEDILMRMQERLSPLEHRVLVAELDGCSTAKIAKDEGITPKAVANALARARRKLRSAASL